MRVKGLRMRFVYGCIDWFWLHNYIMEWKCTNERMMTGPAVKYIAELGVVRVS